MEELPRSKEYCGTACHQAKVMIVNVTFNFNRAGQDMDPPGPDHGDPGGADGARSAEAQVPSGSPCTELHRPSVDELRTWLDEFSVGELWQKNLLGGRP